MNEGIFNLSIRKFLVMACLNSLRAIQQAVDMALAELTIQGTECFPATLTLEVPRLKLNVKFE